jgi:transposase-like protein
MRKTTKSPGEKIVKDIKRATRKHYSSEEKIRIVLDGLRGEDSNAEPCRREGILKVSIINGLRTSWRHVRNCELELHKISLRSVCSRLCTSQY